MREIFFFSYFGHPVTRFELMRHTGLSFEQVESGVELLLAKHIVELHDGFITTSNKFGGVKDQIQLRHAGYRDAIRKWWKLKWIVRYLRMLAPIEQVAVTNSLAIHHTHEDGDADLFVIAKKGHVWRARLMAVLPMMLLRKRPGEAKQHAVDMSYFAEEGTDLKQFAYQDDPYYDYWLKTRIPVIGSSSGLARLADRFRVSASKINVKLPLSEGIAKWIQLKWMPNSTLEAAKGDGKQVVITDAVLKLHTKDRRQEIADYINQRMKLCEELI